ncbi:MAG: hypothetical protein ABI824_02500 [Acidobacteriota bacterium]
MAVRAIGVCRFSLIVVLLCCALNGSGQVTRDAGKQPPKYLGREVTILDPGMGDEAQPKGPATVCIEGPPVRQCYTAPETFENNPDISLVLFPNEPPALFFSVANMGGSGYSIHFALLRPGKGQVLQNLLPGEMSISNQSEHALWSDASISDSPIFLTADFEWGPGEAHYGDHRYMISAYVRKPNDVLLEDPKYYYLEDRYLTLRAYPFWEKNRAILASEKPEILARLRRIRAEEQRRAKVPKKQQ